MLAITQIMELAKRLGAQIRVLYVNERAPYDKLLFEELWTRLTEGLRDCYGVPVPVFALVEGNASEEILRYAKSNGVDLIAMPATDWNPFRRLFHRSTTSFVVRNETCPVWIVAEGDSELMRTPRIVCAVGEGRGSRTIVQNAESLARRLQAQLTLAYAVPELNEGVLARMSQHPPFLSTVMARRYLHGLALSIDSQADCRAEVGTESEVYLRVAKETRSNLLILDRSLHAGVSNLSRVLRKMRCGTLFTDFTRKPLENISYTDIESPKQLTFSS